jgi:hypothetical protein
MSYTEKTIHGAKHSNAVNTGAPDSGNEISLKRFCSSQKKHYLCNATIFYKMCFGYFYTLLASIISSLVRISMSYFATKQIRGCSRLGNFSPFLFTK